jgi:hypothetical protein
MRWLLGAMCVVALSAAWFVGCNSESDNLLDPEIRGDGGDGGSAGVGGEAGSAGVGGGGVGGEGGSGGDLPNCPGIVPDVRFNEDLFACLPDDGAHLGICLDDSCVTGCAKAEEGAHCFEFHAPDYGYNKDWYIGLCVAGFCKPECAVLENGDECISLNAFDGSTVCRDGRCQRRCENDVDCSDYNDCTTEACLPSGLCEENGPVQNGDPCAGGTCRSGECVLETSTLPCTDQGIRNAIATGGGPYTFDCDGPTRVEAPTTLSGNSDYFVDKDVTLDGEGDLEVDSHFVVYSQAGARVVHLIGVTARGIADFGGGTLTLTSSTVSGGGISSSGGTLTLIDTTVAGSIVDGVSSPKSS